MMSFGLEADVYCLFKIKYNDAKLEVEDFETSEVTYMLQEAWIWIIIVIVLAVAATLIVDLIRRKDYRDQVNEKKEEREWKGKESYVKLAQPDMKYEELKEEAVRKTKDNIAGILQ